MAYLPHEQQKLPSMCHICLLEKIITLPLKKKMIKAANLYIAQSAETFCYATNSIIQNYNQSGYFKKVGQIETVKKLMSK